jgi:hypothetical protein
VHKIEFKSGMKYFIIAILLGLYLFLTRNSPTQFTFVLFIYFLIILLIGIFRISKGLLLKKYSIVHHMNSNWYIIDNEFYIMGYYDVEKKEAIIIKGNVNQVGFIELFISKPEYLQDCVFELEEINFKVNNTPSCELITIISKKWNHNKIEKISKELNARINNLKQFSFYKPKFHILLIIFLPLILITIFIIKDIFIVICSTIIILYIIFMNSKK